MDNDDKFIVRNFDLIDTQWNVNTITPVVDMGNVIDLIDTQWNVNTEALYIPDTEAQI